MGLQEMASRAISSVAPLRAVESAGLASRLGVDSSRMALDASTLNGLDRSAVTKVAGFNNEILQKYPERLQLKYENMALSPRRFMTGQPELYTYDMRGLLNAGGVETPLQGDLHMNNFGTMPLSDGTLKVRLNDFDMASFGPPAFDTQRMGTHIQLSAQEMGLSPKQGDQLVETFATSYHDTLKRLADRSKKPGLSPPKAISHMVKDARASNGKAWLDLVAPQVKGKRAFPRDAATKSVSKQTFKDLEQGFETYRSGLSPATAGELAGYKVSDAALYLEGTGSMGLGRYKLLLEAPDGRSPVVLSLKEQVAPAIEAYKPSPLPFASEGARNVAISNLMDGGLSPFRGATSLPLSAGLTSTSYVVEREFPGNTFKNIGKVKKYETFSDLAAYYGSQTALAHASGQAVGMASAADILKSLPAPQAYAKRLASFSRGYAAQVTQDYKAFKQALKADPLLKNQA